MLTPVDMLASDELGMSLVLKEAGLTISIFQVHTPYRALSYLPIEASEHHLHLNVIHCNSLLSPFTCKLCHNNTGGLWRTERVHRGWKGKGKLRSFAEVSRDLGPGTD